MKMKKILTAFFLAVMLLFPLSASAASLGPKIRVGLVVDQYSAELSSAGKITVIDGRGKKVTLSPGRHFISVKGGRFYADKKKLSGGNLSFVAQNASQPVLVNRKKYRGALTAVMTREKKRLTIVNALPVEEYLYGVVAKEVIPLWPDEAIKAQAVAARSFALYHLDHPQYEGFDIKATDQGQVYGGIEAEHPNTTKLVKATRGVTAVYDGEPIQAFFHSTSGGYTEAAVNVWGKDIPYLQAVKDDDKDSPNYSWTKSFTEAQLERTLKQGGYDIGKLQGIRLLPLGKAPMKWSSDRGTSGRVKRMTFKGSRRDVTLTGSQVRSLLGLNSTLFEVTIGTDEPDSIDVSIKNAYGYEVGRKKIPIDKKTRQGMGTKVGDLRLFAGVKDEKVFFVGGGWGHGVGLSQWGARGMALEKSARRKKDYYKTILRHYYRGIYLEERY